MGVKYRERTDVSLAEGSDKYKAESQANLKSYGWADEKATLVRIPIEEGKKRVIKSYADSASK